MSSDEDYTCYGNALDPIDEDSIPRKKPITVEDQFAKDEQGRRRFHGAFTGGFSAGFYNSVGSMEGWQPTQFISSRTNRMGSKNQTILDFMDEEDTGEHGICPISLQVKPAFDAKSSNVDESNLKKRRRLPTNDQRPAFDSWFIRDMLAPTRNTVGVMLLVKMGWKPGQGIGPRLSRREKKRQTRQQSSDVSKKVYGCCLPTEARYNSESSGSEEELDVELNNITFAPNDYEAYIVSPKQNVFGLGYCGINRKPVLSSKQSEFSVLTVAGKSIRGQAFGVSVFEDEDDDIYHKEDMSNYDFSLPYAGELKNIEPQRKSIPSKNKDCIEGFHISETSSSKIKRQSFVLPSIPADFQENRVKKNRWDSPIATGNVCKLKISSAPERSKLLETSNDDAQHNKDDHSDANTIQISEIPLPEQTTTIVHNSNNQMAASDNSGNVKPFAYDVLKQSRYETFLKLKSSQQNTVADKTSNIYPSGMTEWEKERERNEFEQTARLYRPLADELASRFTRGSQEENVHDIATPVEKSYNAESEVLRNASKNKNFGVLTRKKYPWKPDKVVCKRFNIPEPIDNLSCEASSATLISNQKDRMGSVFEFLKKSAYNTASISPVANITTPSTLVTEPMQPQPPSPLLSQPQTTSSNCNVIEQPQTQESNVNVAADEDSENDDQIEKITDKIDLFKAIFLSSSDEENDKDDEPFENSKEAESSSSSYLDGSNSGLRHIETPPVTIMPRADKKEIRYSPARGIFANLDLESMKSQPSFQKKDDSVAIATSADIINSSSEVNAANANNASVYGPKIPSSLLSKASTSEIQRRLPRDCSPVQEVKSHHASTSVWVEKSDKHKMKKSKKSKKKQKKKKSRKEK